MRKRNTNASFGSHTSGSGGGGSDEESGSEPEPVHPDDDSTFRENDVSDGISPLDCAGISYSMLGQLRQGKAWWAQCLTIYIAAVLTYSYNNVSAGTVTEGGDDGGANVQMAIMTIITLVGASPFASSHLLPASIGAFVGGQNIIGSTGPMEQSNREVHPTNYLWLLLLSITVGVVWCFFPKQTILDGYAGRLGSTTFFGMNLTMLTIYGPAGIVDWNRYYYGFAHLIHFGEAEDSYSSSSSVASAWGWTEEAEVAVGYVLSVLWLGVVAGGTRIAHTNYVQRSANKVTLEGSSSNGDSKPPPTPLNNVLVPVLYALISMILVNATNYRHATALYNGFAVGSYVAMASLQRIPTVTKFAIVSGLAALWGLALTPFFVGFAGKSGFTSMLGHASHTALEAAHRRMQRIRRRRQDELRRQLQQMQAALQEQHEAMMEPLPKKKERNDTNEEEAPPSPTHGIHRHKPKQETFYTKQQRRQARRLKRPSSPEMQSDPPTKLHHRAWSALPQAEGDDGGRWHHSLEPSQRQEQEQEQGSNGIV